MNIPEIAYNFQQLIDTAGGTAAIVSRNLSGSGTSTSVTTAIYTVPSDRILILGNAAARATPGAGQICQNCEIDFGLGAGAQAIGIKYGPGLPVAAADEKVDVLWTGCVWIGPGENIFSLAGFNSGVASNSLDLSIHGILIPRGNVQQA